MKDSEENLTPGEEPESETTKENQNSDVARSLSDWAEFSFLIQKLDGEFAKAFKAPQYMPEGFVEENSKAPNSDSA